MHGFEAGSRINTDVLDSQQRLAQQRYPILMAQLNLLASTGNLNDGRLRGAVACWTAKQRGRSLQPAQQSFVIISIDSSLTKPAF
ncbi:hypothetical protein PSAN_41480 [Pseudomonas antarctica]|uniref:Uncharacterized protein n=1 Tax=Pseudomonas antarctica TaxID=219572 RepID=A0ABQ6ZS74_9PSED|nr:hypothetical protein [Pseudomonas antarctica]KAF2407220.1 hypothetical protein PSAN_41480 [Pseudomonas antarctica]